MREWKEITPEKYEIKLGSDTASLEVKRNIGRGKYEVYHAVWLVRYPRLPGGFTILDVADGNADLKQLKTEALTDIMYYAAQKRNACQQIIDDAELARGVN